MPNNTMAEMPRGNHTALWDASETVVRLISQTFP